MGIMRSDLRLSTGKTPRTEGFTLVELLTVIAVIAILASLLLPGTQAAMQRAKRIHCVSSLRQQGIGFHTYAHDHQGHLPASVAMAEGGAREFVQNGYRVGGPFYFSYRLFQVLSNELNTPKILICKSELTREPAFTFATLQNTNLSYFVGVNADLSKPGSILSGDRNLTCNPRSHPTIIRLTSGASFWWTTELHPQQGNLLFADGHAEEWSRYTLTRQLHYDPTEPYDIFLPTAR
jgi:prepilin-type N-terminal cleavage/methylation domain-containing protein/prepilin-type processing-associated H-X9-DG protein